MIEMNPLRGNAHLVDALGSALRRGEHGLSTVPGLLKRVIREESWREFITQRGEHVRHERFVEFVVTPPLRGIGASVALLQDVCRHDPEALDLLDQALLDGSRQGKRNDLVNNINEVTERPMGTSMAYALRKLRKDAPELHAEVLAGRLSAHAAMVKAGFRPPTFTVRADSPKSIAATLRRRLPPDVLAEVARLLREG